MENKSRELIRTRIEAELANLAATGGIKASLIKGDQDYVLYHQLETSGGSKGLPVFTDVLVAVPHGYPTAQIDMPALLLNSPLASVVVGGTNPQAIVSVGEKQWRFLSFHPYSGQGSPTWSPNKHGFDNYYHHLYTWLHKI